MTGAQERGAAPRWICRVSATRGEHWLVEREASNPADLVAIVYNRAFGKQIASALNNHASLLALVREFVYAAYNPSTDLLKRAAAALDLIDGRQP